MAIIEAARRVIGKPLNAAGISAVSILSRIPARINMAIVKPIPEATPFTKAYSTFTSLSSVTFINATPKTAQFEVINGRYTPSALYSEGENLFTKISTSCIKAAITKIKTIVLRYSKPAATNARSMA